MLNVSTLQLINRDFGITGANFKLYLSSIYDSHSGGSRREISNEIMEFGFEC